MEKWEYQTIELKRKTDEWDAKYFSEQQNVYGQQGWELVSWFSPTVFSSIGVTGTRQVFATFKRKEIWQIYDNHTLLFSLRKLFNTGKFCDAEDLLHSVVSETPDIRYYKVALQFYRWLEKLNDDELANGNFSREEILDGRITIKKLLDIDNDESTSK